MIRALHIGLEPQVLDTVHLAAGEQREVSRTLTDISVVIDPVRTAADSRCRVRPDGASTVARLFHNARTALLASQLVSPDDPIRTRVRVTTTEGSMPARHQEFVSDSLRMFRSLSVDSLARVGYVTRNRDGSMAYRAPDAEVLADDRFIANYCLFLVEGTGDRAGWTGVGFRPARLRGSIVEVKGTLWLDTATSELRRLEFSYAGAEPAVEQANAGGWLSFTHLGSGLRFVDGWELRMPRLGEATVLRRRDGMSGRLREVTGIQVLRGEVLETTVNAWPRYTTGDTDHVDGSGRLMPDSTLHDPTLSDPARCGAEGGVLVHGLVISARGELGAALPDTDVRFTWAAAPHAPPKEQRARSDAEGRYHVCGIPTDQLVSIEAAQQGHEPAALSLRVPPGRRAAKVDLLLPRNDGA